MSVSIGYSAYQLSQNIHGTKIKVGVVQGNVPNERRWSPKAGSFILRDYFSLSQKLVADHVDLIVWPESAYPGYYGEDPGLCLALKEFIIKTKTSHLIGTITKKQEEYFNSAAFFSSSGKPEREYHKIHLVPFGEYIPFRKQIPFLSLIVPIDDFTRGREYALFEAPEKEARAQKLYYSVLICFEDTVPELVSGFVKNGANLLINMSNDAWFQDTREPFLHLQSAVFRSIENRRYLVRAGNVGVSCFLDPFGRTINRVRNSLGKGTYVEGVAAQEVYLLRQGTFYTKFGDFFAYFCISGILMMAILNIGKYQARRRSK